MNNFSNILRWCALLVQLAIAGVAQAQTNPAPYTTGYRYDAGARLVGTIKPSAVANGTTGPFLASRIVYNAQGVVDHVDEGSLSGWQADNVQPSAWTGFTIFKTTTFTYDNSGRKISESEGSGGTAYKFTQYNYDDGGRVECVAVRMNPSAFGSQADACSLGQEGTQGPDRITYTTYDALDRPLQIQKAYRTSLAYPYETNTYYPGGPQESTTDANGNYTYYSYDPYVRLQRWYFPSPTTKGSYNTADFEEYAYDLNGNRTSLRKRDGRTIGHTYDALNRVTLESYPGGTIDNVYFGYDLRGLQLYARFDSATGNGLTTSYDGFGNVKTSSTNQSGSTRSLGYLYDAEGNRTRVTHPDNAYFQYVYDGLNRLTTIQENGATTLVSQTYLNNGKRWTVSRGATVSSTTYGYDDVLRLKTLTHDLVGSPYDVMHTFGYNPADQVVSRNLSNGLYSFVQAPTIQTTYLVNGLNQYSQLSSSGSVSPGYDLNGNMTFDGATTFGYDILNRMTSATPTVAGGKTGNLSYDPRGRLFQTWGGPSGTTQFLYDGDALVAEYDGAGNLLRRYVHGAGVDEPLVGYEGSTVGSANRRYFHADHQGSVVAIADTNGNGIQSNTYDPYGVPATGNVSRFQYTGQIILPDLGQYYYKARIYNPSLGRFMQTDPIGYKDEIDLYSYVKDDPIDGRDPSGLDGCVTHEEGQTCTTTYNNISLIGAAALVAGAAINNTIVAAQRYNSKDKDAPATNSDSNSKTKKDPEYSVRVQAQGDLLKADKSVPLNETRPIGATEVKAALAMTAAQLTPKEQKMMAPAFAKADQWIDRVAAAGGTSVTGRSFSFNLTGVGGSDARVDIELIRGDRNIVP